MSFKRNRTTWGKTDRKASAAPADPGYGSEDQDHPAHQDDPAYEKYKKGDPSAWAEDVNQPPYPEGNPPSVPGYDTEDQDHPAHKKNPRVPKDAALSAQIQRKAAKCLALARYRMGKGASQETVESLALDLMDMPDRSLEANLQRAGGGFLAMDEDDMFLGCGEGFGEDLDDDLDDDLGEDLGDNYEDDIMGMEDDFVEDVPTGPPANEDIMGMMSYLASQLKSLKASLAKSADQNDPKDDTLSPDAESEDEARTEGKKARAMHTKLANYFTKNGGGDDGFVLEEDWTGSKALFAGLDTDGDGIVATSELVAAMFDPSDELLHLADGFTPEETGYMTACGEMVLAGEVPEAFKKQWEKNDKGDDKEDKDEDKDSGKPWEKDKGDEKKSGKKANDDEDEDDEEGMEASKKKATDDDDEDDVGGDSDPEEKEAALSNLDLFGGSAGHDPMGLATDQGLSLNAADEQLLTEIFSEGLPGHSASDLPGVEDTLPAPRPRQASTGVSSLGHQTRTASKGLSDVENLSQLWKSDPDVSKVFGMD